MLAPHTQQTNRLNDAFARMFPLPLTTIESFMWIDACAAFPMMADLELHFRGAIDREAFDSALKVALARAPLFRSIIRLDEDRRPVWVLTDHPPRVDWAPLGTPLGQNYDTFVDLTKEAALRVWVRQGADRATVRLHFHHACADGMGGFAFIEDFLAAYDQAQAKGSNSVELRPLDPDRLVQRGNPGTEGRGIYRGMIDTLIGAREGARFFLQKPVSLSHNGRTAISDEDRQVGFLTRSCPESTAARLREAAMTNQTSVNDLLIRELFATLRDWNRTHNDDPHQRRLRILMPQNLREREDRAAPVANLLGFAFVTRRARECDQPELLLSSIHEETTAVRHGQLSRYFLGGLATIESVGLLRRLLQSRICFATAVLSNLGDPTRRFVARFPRIEGGLRVGNLRFERVTGSPPLRAGTRASFCIVKDQRTFTLSLKCDPHLFSKTDAQQLMDAYLKQLAG